MNACGVIFLLRYRTMKFAQISIVLAICRGVLCANDLPTLQLQPTTPSPESASFGSPCLQSNSGQDLSKLPGRVLRISGCVDVPLSTDPDTSKRQDGGSARDHHPASVYVVAVHDDNTICTGSLELEGQQPQGRFTLDVSLSDKYFSWPVFIDICRDVDFDKCRLVKVVSPEGGAHEDQSVAGENINERRHVKASRLMTSLPGNDTAVAVLYEVYIDLCTSSTQHVDKHDQATTSLLYRKLSTNQPKNILKRSKRQTSDNAGEGGIDEEMKDGTHSADWVRRIPAQFANNRRGSFDQSLDSHSPAAAAASATVARRKWKNGAAMQWIRKKSGDSVASNYDNVEVNEENGVDEDYPDERKRKWAKNGMGWIKRKWNKPGMGWLKRGEEDKRKWKSNAGMKWV